MISQQAVEIERVRISRMDPKEAKIDSTLRMLVPGSRTFFEKKVAPVDNHSSGWIEITTFVGKGEGKRRFDFSFPAFLWIDFSSDEVIRLIQRAVNCDLSR